MHDGLKRYQVHVLRDAGLTVKEVAAKAGVSRSSVKRMLKEPKITSLEAAPVGRGPGRPGVARAFEAPVRKILEAEPDLPTVEVLRRIGQIGYAGRALSAAVHDLFRRLKQVLAAGPPMEQRRAWKERFDQELAALIQAHPQAEKGVTYLRGGQPWWFTCLLHPGMEPTNNLAEQSLREHVIVRKLIGTFRSESGAQHYQYIASLMISWRLQDKNPFEELLALLRRELCLK